MIVHIPDKLYHGIINYSLKQQPEEACGFILGSPIPSRGVNIDVISFVAMRNISSHPLTHFEMHPAEMIPYLTDKQQPIVGIFHSHPTAPPLPSQRDLQTLWHDIPTHWILSLQKPHFPELQIYETKKATPTTYHKLSFVIG
ncbi:hypothetical protein GCM10008018_12010 [Paenibacillus marchantiophytorum]|uniref:MPN domain-containing protein n=1 Tax=Paenibacillus marchantiophytorum TaxID=1619310 RepID=A0ABQ2BSY9_9BACL|nr:M67 family metallopeptidase [Paenibacillus marchantiophytorum]GGI45424.1 hypothetical protein GCM10008018_12010 [Paenibacillus marchantiophytorum]